MATAKSFTRIHFSKEILSHWSTPFMPDYTFKLLCHYSHRFVFSILFIFLFSPSLHCDWILWFLCLFSCVYLWHAAAQRWYNSVRTDLMENGANSTLFIAKVRKSDTGNYTCSIGPNDFYTINVHVLNGKSQCVGFFLIFNFDPCKFCEWSQW